MKNVVKELISDFRAIYGNDRKVLVAMVVLLLVGVILFLLPIINLNPAVSRTWVKYSDINSGYLEGSWWYLLSFSVLSVLMTFGHCLIGARLYAKRGASVAMLFIIVSIAVVLMAIAYLLKILGEG
jgi:hypothetical protein